MKHITFTLVLFALVAAVFADEPPKPFAGASGEYTKLVWSDEFDYKGPPDAKKWGYEVGYIRNNEKQYYTRERGENATVKDGHLVITARKNDLVLDGKTYPITSASVISKGKGFWQRGRIEVRAKVPVSLGTWPAVWMLPEEGRGGWPKSGEIDILEHVGYEPQNVHFNVHVEKYNHVKGNGKGKAVPIKTQEEFHVYALEWFDDRLDFYFDDQKVFSYANENEGNTSWPFDKPFYVILNLAYGGAWGGSKGTDETKLPQEFLIDYVRVFGK
ncbi:MAG: glycoside hydrolase family 16 protein [Planctomycetaceae bacterium]|jgi:beta-glucanase (GH16 family)|nr:glycoside hydrolase family 16 protein [Planctomycetaceae bacterium]